MQTQFSKSKYKRTQTSRSADQSQTVLKGKSDVHSRVVKSLDQGGSEGFGGHVALKLISTRARKCVRIYRTFPPHHQHLCTLLITNKCSSCQDMKNSYFNFGGCFWKTYYQLEIRRPCTTTLSLPHSQLKLSSIYTKAYWIKNIFFKNFW